MNDGERIVVFSKSYCPYCNATKSLLGEFGAKYQAVELDLMGISLLPPVLTVLCMMAWLICFAGW